MGARHYLEHLGLNRARQCWIVVLEVAAQSQLVYADFLADLLAIQVVGLPRFCRQISAWSFLRYFFRS